MKKLSRKEIINKLVQNNIPLTILGDYKNCRTPTLFKCYCGNLFNVKVQSVLSLNTKSCGCLHKSGNSNLKDISNEIFGHLLVIKFAYFKKAGSQRRKAYWWCKCECGNIKAIRSNDLLCNKRKRCGECKLHKNGVPYSFIQQEISGWVNGELNYKVENIYIDVAMPKEKIAIEYDSWYWHKHQFIKDCKRVNKLLNKGWKVITIRSGRKLPDKKEFLKHIEKAENNNTRYWHILTLSDWGK